MGWIYDKSKSCNFYNDDFIHYYPGLRFSKCKELGNNHKGWNYMFREQGGGGGCSFFKNCNKETREMPKSMGLTYEKQIRKEWNSNFHNHLSWLIWKDWIKFTTARNLVFLNFDSNYHIKDKLVVI